jgi:hypothetical protein
MDILVKHYYALLNLLFGAAFAIAALLVLVSSLPGSAWQRMTGGSAYQSVGITV